jgi:copper oxidase (laccase) domain-containing protein
VGYVRKQLDECGVGKEKIEVSEIDTVVNRNYFSHHRSYFTGEPEGRFATVVCLSVGDDKQP